MSGGLSSTLSAMRGRVVSAASVYLAHRTRRSLDSDKVSFNVGSVTPLREFGSVLGQAQPAVPTSHGTVAFISAPIHRLDKDEVARKCIS